VKGFIACPWSHIYPSDSIVRFLWLLMSLNSPICCHVSQTDIANINFSSFNDRLSCHQTSNMLAYASRRSLSSLRTTTRHLSQARPFHPPPSPLLANVDPCRRRLLPSLARANATFALQARGIQGAAAIPKLFFKVFRVPAGGIAVVTGGFAFINYKVQGLSLGWSNR
jgi:hypothetical protein